MHLSGVTDPAAFAKANEICIKLGQFFQIQDDYLDCYGDPEVIGKIGTDIQDNKCGWLVVQALKRCDDSQRKIIEENYGKKDAECEKRVKELYVALEMESVYKKYEEESYERTIIAEQGQHPAPRALRRHAQEDLQAKQVIARNVMTRGEERWTSATTK